MAAGLADPEGKDSCGVGMVVSVAGAADHSIVEAGLRVLERLAHRGAENADGLTGDGAGITVQIPHAFYQKLGMPLPAPGSYGTGIIFLPRDPKAAEAAWGRFRTACAENGLSIFADREVPADHSVPGPLALASEPLMRQAFVVGGCGGVELERKLFRMDSKLAGATHYQWQALPYAASTPVGASYGLTLAVQW